MKGNRFAAVLLLAVAASSCFRGRGSSKVGAGVPAGNGIWFANGFAGRESENEAEASLSRGGFSWVLLPAARIERRDGRWFIVKLKPPPEPFARLPVSLVIEGGLDAALALSSNQAAVRRSLEDTLAVAGRTVIGEGTRFGSVRGVHLDLPFTAETTSAYGALVQRVRRRLPSELFLSVSLRFDPPAGEKKKLWPLAPAADGLIAMIFGEHDQANPASADLLGKPWWAGYEPGSEGRWTSGKGDDRGSLPESFLATLSDDPRMDFHLDVEIGGGAGVGYIFKARRSFAVGARQFAAGDEIVFRQPSIADMAWQLRTDIAGRRFARGRVVRLAGASESERFFTLAALNDILLGRPLLPSLRVSVEPGKNSVSVSAENLSSLPTLLSRTSNWIEVDLTQPGIRDVHPGGFDRYEVYAANGRRVSLGRAERVRFYETLVGPSEKIEPATILMRRGAPSGCCRLRFHLIAASGAEVASDWTEAHEPGNGNREPGTEKKRGD
jgi:hypothetical protein